jgi:hypothetical protein
VGFCQCGNVYTWNDVHVRLCPCGIFSKLILSMWDCVHMGLFLVRYCQCEIVFTWDSVHGEIFIRGILSMWVYVHVG